MMYLFRLVFPLLACIGPFPGSSRQIPVLHVRGRKSSLSASRSHPSGWPWGEGVRAPAAQTNRRPRQRPGPERDRPRPPPEAAAEPRAGSAVLEDGVGSWSSPSRALSSAAAQPCGRGRGKRKGSAPRARPRESNRRRPLPERAISRPQP